MEKKENKTDDFIEIKVVDKRHSAKESVEKEGEGKTETKKYPSYIEELRSELDKKEKILKEYIDSYKKMKEENESFRARFKKDMEKRLESAKIDYISNFLVVFDNLERAIGAAENSQNVQALLDGVKLIQSQFFAKLKSDGIEELDPTGKPFDPQTQEAVEIIPVEEKEKDNIVLSQCEKGYLIGEKLLRPAKVRVGKIKNEERESA